MSVSAVIPAYNEADDLPKVLSVLSQSSLVDEVIVVDDASDDGSANTASSYETVQLLQNETNRGKGYSIGRGYRESEGDVVLFLDADLIGLTDEHLETLVRPVLSGETDSTLGIFQGGRGATDLAQQIAPGISGQRAVRREALEDFDEWDCRFGIELALNYYFRREGIAVSKVDLPNLTHRMKEEKRGLLDGILQRMRMYWEISRLHLSHLFRR